MITAVFTDNSDYARATGLWQWDYGQRLRIEGLKLPTAIEIHFALTEQSGDAITRVGATKDGVTEVVIPDSLLENQAAGATYEIYAWIYLADKTSGETIKRISMQVKRRPKPEERDTPEDAELFREAIAQVNASADRAETAREGAEAAQKAAEAAAGKIEGEITGAGQIAEQVKQDAAAVADDRSAVSQLATETTQNAQKAAEAAQAAERSSTAAKEAQTAAESAKAGATAAMEEVERDRVEVSETHKAVEQLREVVDTDRQAVAADRQAVENTALQFGQAAQSAINAVGQAQEAAVGAVSAEGQRQTTAVQQAGTQAVSGVAEAKTTAVQAVTSEGDVQVGRVREAAAEIAADREQIAANKQAIEALHQNKADAIVETAQGETMTLTDSSDKLFRGLRVFGRSMQAKTTGAQLFDVTNVDMKTILNIDGTTSSNGSIHTSGFIKVLPNETYSVSSTRQNRGKFYDINKRVLTTDKFDFELSNNGDKFTTLESVEYVRFSIYETADLNTLMMNQGDTLKPYEPYSGGFPSPSPDWEQPILNAGESGSITVEVTGRNLLKPSLVPEVQGIYLGWKIKDDDKNVTVSIIDKKPNEPLYNGLYIGVSGNGINANEGAVWVLTNGRITNAHIVTKFKYFTIYNQKNVPISELLDRYDIQIEYGTAPTPYEPYTHQSLTLATPNGLPGVPVRKDGNYTDQNGQQWVCDEVDLGRGKYVQRVSNLTFDGVTDGHKCIDTDGYKSNGFTNAYTPVPNKKLNGAVLMNILTGRGSSGVGFISSSVIGLSFGNERCGIIETDSKIDIVNKVNAVIKEINDTGTEVIAYYELEIPIERDLTPEELAAYEALHTNYPTTVITNDAGAHMETSYVADTGTYIRNMEERLNAKLVNIQSALISQKISGGGIKVADSARVPVVQFVMWGKTEQVRTSGKNLIDIKGETTFSKGTFDIKDNLIDCTLEDTWGGSYIMFSKEYPAGEYAFSADKMKNGAVQKMSVLLTVKPLSYSSNSCTFNDYYKKYLIKNGNTLSRDITFKVDSPFEIGIAFSGDNDAVGETLSVKNIQLERGASITAYEPYSGGFPSPSPDWEQPIEITDQPVTVTIKGGTEQQSITLTPPKPMTKWDKLEKVDGVWCWVYQSRWVESYTDESITGEYISTTGGLDVGAKICYKSTPELIPLSPSEQDKLNALTMYAPETEVTNTGGCNMELTYTVDTKSYVDSKIAAISAAVLEV